MLLGQQAGYTKYPYLLCEWDRRDKKNHRIKKEWPHGKAIKPRNKNVIKGSLVDPSQVLLLPLHIKLGLMKQFIKALSKEGSKEGESFKYLGNKFPGLSEANIKEGVSVGPDNHKLRKGKVFECKMEMCEKEA
ncbi:hypothetical protein AVEN_169728-1 [Araneus ventricosus]|uniref:Uncharacterized protein n=1 Tax=Araneus ventricosus TaxID=182803 RepID=A0A4Y2QLD0_ARAVE|nr:hypothetical protein AVEN_117927-1 [Araneus ventricosus]GBN64138.1 hypothetical protein AVEN_169728-1 [Araneus ventricosus]